MNLPHFNEISSATTFLNINEFVMQHKKYTKNANDTIFLLCQLIHALYTDRPSSLHDCRIVSTNVVVCDITPDELAILLDGLFKKLEIA